MDRLQTAIYSTVHGYQDPQGGKGAVALSPKVGIPSGSLSNMANPEQPNKLGLEESIPLQLVSKNFEILFAYATELGFIPPVPFVDFSNTSDTDLINLVTKFYADIGKASQALNDALKDGKITSVECERVFTTFLESQQAGHELICRMRALCQAEAARGKR